MEIKIFTNEQSWSLQTISRDHLEETPKARSIVKLYRQLNKGSVIGDVSFLFNSEKELINKWDKVCKKFTILQAAGGIVKNESGALLFIERLGKWDLPKGKIEKGESVEEGARREVIEECNIVPVLDAKLGETWHTYEFKGKHILKLTHWYAMHCTNEEAQKVKPQAEEDITQVCWFTPKEVTDTIDQNTYRSIKEIYAVYNA